MTGANTDHLSRTTIRPADSSDLASILAMLDDAVRWLCARGIEGQWGSTPFSARESTVDRVTGWVRQGLVQVAEQDDELLGVLALGPAPDYVPVTTVPEVYVVALVAGRTPTAKGTGARLLRLAEQRAIDEGVDRVRLDCWAGGSGRLIDYYRDQGYQPVETFDFHGWPGQVLQRELDRR